MRKMKVSFYGTKEIVGLATELKKMQKHSHGLTRNYTEKNKKRSPELAEGSPSFGSIKLRLLSEPFGKLRDPFLSSGGC